MLREALHSQSQFASDESSRQDHGNDHVPLLPGLLALRGCPNVCAVLDFYFTLGPRDPMRLSLIDLGLSRRFVHNAGKFAGTVAYAASEQLLKGEHNMASDVWSLGVTQLELVINERITNRCEYQQLFGDLHKSVLTEKEG